MNPIKRLYRWMRGLFRRTKGRLLEAVPTATDDSALRRLTNPSRRNYRRMMRKLLKRKGPKLLTKEQLKANTAKRIRLRQAKSAAIRHMGRKHANLDRKSSMWLTMLHSMDRRYKA